MLFRKREKGSLRRRFRLWLWPRVSWRRSTLYYLKRVLRLSGTPYSIAMGTAVGAFVSCTPFVGLHILISFVVAWLLRGNMVASAIGTFIGNPLTFPFIWAGTYEVGHFMLRGFGRSAPVRLEHDLAHGSWAQLRPLIEPMTLGSIPIGLAVGCIVYFIVYKAVSVYQKGRRERFSGRRQAGSPVE